MTCTSLSAWAALRVQHHVVAPGGEPHDLPGAGEVGGQVGDRQVLDQDAEQPLAEPVREVELLQAPARGEPGLGDEEEDRLAAARRFVERAFPPLARRDAALGIEVEEEIVPALARQPVAQRDGLGVIRARMTEKNPRHETCLDQQV